MACIKYYLDVWYKRLRMKINEKPNNNNDTNSNRSINSNSNNMIIMKYFIYRDKASYSVILK